MSISLKKIEKDKYYESILLVRKDTNVLPVHYLISRLEGDHIIKEWGYQYYIEIADIINLPI